MLLSEELPTAFVAEKKAGRIRKKNEAAIIESAELEFARLGFAGASIKSIAERAGLPKSNILYYFKSKLGLYRAVLTQILDHWESALGSIQPDLEPTVAIGNYIRAKLTYSQQHPVSSRIFATEMNQGAPHLPLIMQERMRNSMQSKIEVLQKWVDTGKLQKVEPAHVLLLIWSATEYYANNTTQVRWALNQSQLSEQEYQLAYQTIVTTVLGGVVQ